MKSKDCKNCLFVGSVSASTKAVFCRLNKQTEFLACKDFTDKQNLPTWEQIVRKNEVEQIALHFGSPVEPEMLPTNKNEILAYVDELAETHRMIEEYYRTGKK